MGDLLYLLSSARIRIFPQALFPVTYPKAYNHLPGVARRMLSKLKRVKVVAESGGAGGAGAAAQRQLDSMDPKREPGTPTNAGGRARMKGAAAFLIAASRLGSCDDNDGSDGEADTAPTTPAAALGLDGKMTSITGYTLRSVDYARGRIDALNRQLTTGAEVASAMRGTRRQVRKAREAEEQSSAAQQQGYDATKDYPASVDLSTPLAMAAVAQRVADKQRFVPASLPSSSPRPFWKHSPYSARNVLEFFKGRTFGF
jgi:hypothetical protein